jgi:hypothetical protein
LAFQEFHDDERLAFVFIDVVNGADVGMIKSGRSARFAFETLEGVGISRSGARNLSRHRRESGIRRPKARLYEWQELQRHKALKPGVFGLIHHAHAATTQPLHDAVVGNGLPDHDFTSREHSGRTLRL